MKKILFLLGGALALALIPLLLFAQSTNLPPRPTPGGGGTGGTSSSSANQFTLIPAADGLAASNVLLTAVNLRRTNYYYPATDQKWLKLTNDNATIETNLVGFYNIKLTNGTLRIWTNVAQAGTNNYAIVFDPTNTFGGYSALIITNAGGTVLYYGLTNVPSVLPTHLTAEEGIGSPYLIGTNLGTLYTNHSYLAVNGILEPRPATNTWLRYVDPVNGDNTVAAPGPARPYRTAAAAALLAPSNTLIMLAPGRYPIESIVLPAGVSLCGAGRDITIIGTTNSSTHSLSVAGNSSLNGLTFYGHLNCDGTSNRFHNLDIQGAVDAILGGFAAGSVNFFESCNFSSAYDTMNVGGNATNQPTATFLNCSFTVENTGLSTIGRTIVVGTGVKLYFTGCSLTALNFGGTNGPNADPSGCVIGVNSADSRVELAGCALRYPTTNTLGQFAVNYNFANGTNVFTHGEFIRTNDVRSGSITIINKL